MIFRLVKIAVLTFAVVWGAGAVWLWTHPQPVKWHVLDREEGR